MTLVNYAVSFSTSVSSLTFCVICPQLCWPVVHFVCSTFFMLASPVCCLPPFIPSHIGISLDRPVTSSQWFSVVLFTVFTCHRSRFCCTDPGYSAIPFKLVSTICYDLFVDLADLLPGNLKANKNETQTFLEVKLVLTPWASSYGLRLFPFIKWICSPRLFRCPDLCSTSI